MNYIISGDIYLNPSCKCIDIENTSYIARRTDGGSGGGGREENLAPGRSGKGLACKASKGFLVVQYKILS